jgi:hypothetical protein
VTLHDHKREAIREAPVLVSTIPVQFYRSVRELKLIRHYLDPPVGVNPAIAFRRY